ncbi:MAG: hypothetical protein V3S45_08915 [Kiloniellales bacterium]|nr:hypothetical protein [Caulobacteraceae bacterium]
MRLWMIGAGAALCVGGAQAADAAQVQPVTAGATTFTGSGVVNNCPVTLAGTFNPAAGTASITSVAFAPGVCSAVAAQNLPWTMQAVSTTSVVFHGVRLQSSILGVCGPGDLTAAWNNTSHQASFTGPLNPGNCPVVGSVTAPGVQVIP